MEGEGVRYGRDARRGRGPAEQKPKHGGDVVVRAACLWRGAGEGGTEKWAIPEAGAHPQR
jgi:hypothetical protein